MTLRRLIAGAAALLPALATAQGIDAPRLGAASNFGQGWQPEMMEAAAMLPVTDFRDAVYWRDIETSDGQYDYGGMRRSWPDRLPERGAGMSLTVNNGHPDRDGGNTPHSPGAVAAFARFAAEAVTRFPAIHTVEVGNEMNSDTFVSGPGWDTDLKTRAVSYTALLAETARAVRAARPGTRIVGGAAHSIPLAWFSALFEAGAGAYMDALVIHPYGTAPEQIARMIARLRSLPEAADLPIEVTEFGHTDPAIAPAHLLKNYCQMALAGVDRVIWYPLNPRGDGLVPLIDVQGNLTEVGRAYRFIAQTLTSGTVTDAAPDPFTYGCLFGGDRVVIWGEPRALTVGEGVTVTDATGDPVPDDGLSLSMSRPLVLRASGDLLSQFSLGTQQVLADSVHQFAFDGDGDPFQRLVASGPDHELLDPRPGQEKNGAPWNPYLGSSWDGVLRAGADWVLPSLPPDGPLSVAYHFTAPRRVSADLSVAIAPSDRSEDGVDLTIRAAGETLLSKRVTGAETIGPLPVRLRRRQTLEVIVGPGETAKGDVTRLRVTLRRPGASDP